MISKSKHKSSDNVAVTAKKHQVITMETERKIIERVEQGEQMVHHLFKQKIVLITCANKRLFLKQ